MRVLLSTIGSRGDVQPLVALALRLRELGHEPRLCAPPDFRDWIADLGLPVTPIGPELRRIAAAPAGAAPSPEDLRRLAEASVATQFETVAEAARRCDVIVGATALQIAARSVAELMDVPYVFAAYAPVVLPSPLHAPPPMPSPTPDPGTGTNEERWARNAEGFNAGFRSALNAHRAKLGLGAVEDVRSHVLTGRPWLAADRMLAPWPDPEDDTVFQPGAWIVPDDRPLPSALEAFLDAGEAPVFFGFGSMHVAADASRTLVETARALGRRSILSRGWADLTPIDDAPDCFVVGEVNQQALFARVAAVVHHGGAGTTTAGALAGAAHVVVPQRYDQHYWARRVQDLGIGIAHAPGTPSTASLTEALEAALASAIATRAAETARLVRRDGVTLAAERLLGLA